MTLLELSDWVLMPRWNTDAHVFRSRGDLRMRRDACQWHPDDSGLTFFLLLRDFKTFEGVVVREYFSGVSIKATEAQSVGKRC